jgi:hypothetical protein
MKLSQYAPDPFRALTGAFFARFFESEITTGFDDLKSPFFWLLAALAIPGMFIPWIMAFDWHLIAMLKGPLALREASQAEKTFYLGFSMIASGLLTTIVWSTLLPDRRDTLILGALPVRSSTIVAAKLVALAAYVLLTAVAMHIIGAVFFGSVLATNTGTLFAVRGIFAHFVAASAASAAVALIVAGAQGLTLAIAGPRVFRRLATLLQVCLVGLMAVGLAFLPIIMFSVVHTIRGFGGRMRPWVLSTPPVWFLGLYEWLLGTSDPVLLGLARNAGLTLLVGVAVTVLAYPIAYRRLMVSVVERGAGPGRNPVGRSLRALLIGSAGRHPEARAAADFYTATIARVERHRFVLAMTLGIAIAWVMVAWLALEPPTEEPTAGWLSLPLSTMLFLIVGLRIAASLPGDVRSGWLFELREPARAHARRALERVMFLLGIVPPFLIAAPVYWWLWGRDVAIIHTAVSVALAIVIVAYLIWHCDGMPCGQRWALARVSLGYRWPLYLAGFFLITVWIPRLELLLFRHVYIAGAFVATLFAAAAITRYTSARHVIVPSYDDVDPVAGVLRLN